MTDSKPTLAATVALLEATLEATRDGILVLDLDGRVVCYNQKFLGVFGLTADALAARGVSALVDAVRAQVEDADRLIEGARAEWAQMEGEIANVMRFRDGRVFQRFVAPHRVGGRVAGRVISYHDVSEPARAAAALDRYRAILEKAQEVAHIGSWAAELDGSNSLGWSAESYRIFGVAPAGFAGTTDAFFAFVHPDDVASVRQAAADAIDSGRPYSIEHRICRADGEVRWVHEQADVVRDDAGRAVRMIGTVQDVTERRRLEEQLRAAQRLEAIGRLAGGVAHDINNALTAIVGYTELAIGELDEAHPARADVQEIRRAAERAESVTRQLLAFSRKQLLAPRLFSLSDSVVNLGRLLTRLLGPEIHLVTSVADDVPPIYGDSGQIEQAILNLAVNARDAMPDGGRLTLSVAPFAADEAFASRHQPMQPGRYVEVRVADTGQGMTPEVRDHLFEPFFTTKGVGKGTGLGLAMVYGTVQQSGGLIFVESAPGQGSTFRLYFPPAPRGAPAVRAAAGPSSAAMPTVLVVEDERQVRALVVMALEQDGYRILQAGSAREALELAAAHDAPIDLLLTDATMPEMGGVELAATLARERPALRVVLMSGYTADEVAVSGVAAPVLLQKPFTPRELRQRIRGILAPAP